MSTVTLDVATTEKMANFLAAAGPRLEAAEMEKKAFEQAVPNWVDKAVESGLIRPTDRDATVRIIQSGGIAKTSEFIDLVLKHVGPSAMGRPATDSGSADMSAEDRYAATILS